MTILILSVLLLVIICLFVVQLTLTDSLVDELLTERELLNLYRAHRAIQRLLPISVGAAAFAIVVWGG